MVKRSHIVPRACLAAAACLFGLSLLPAQEGTPTGSLGLPPVSVERDARIASLRLRWEMEGIQTAIQDGFIGVAKTLVDRLLEDPPEEEAAHQKLLRYRLQIALIRGDMETASRAMATLRERGSAPDPLNEALYLFFSGDPEAAATRLADLDPTTLPVDRLAWVRFLQALILTRQGATEEANSLFLEAENLAPTDLLQDHFEIIRVREEIAAGNYDEASISALRESVRSMRGERAGFEAARLLALALNRMGDQAGAIEVLNTHLAMPGLREFNLRSDLLLIMGIISGPESPRGRLALRQIMSDQAKANQQSVALTLLAQSSTTQAEREALLTDINNWLQQEPPHPLTDRLLAYKAYFLVSKGNFQDAEESARRLMQAYPSSDYVAASLWMLAYSSWNQTPPRYRTAADYLNQLRQRLRDSREAVEAGILIADCYFLNGDFASAADAYGAILREVPARMAGDVFFQRILSELNADRPSSAAELIDSARDDPRIAADSLWRAEWNLLDYLRREERVDLAYERIRTVLTAARSGLPLTPSLALRFRWLEARLTLEAGPPAEAVALANTLLDDLEAGVYAELPLGQVEEMESHLLLLKGEAQIASGQKTQGLATFSRLREKFPQGGPTILSYLVESRSESGQDNLVSAQQSLVALVDRFPGSEYAPIALWEAALNAEQRGLNVHLQEAIGILERLVTEYPGDELVYYARLKQGDLARRLNDFPTALLLYERLLNQYPQHPERYRAELSRADCLMALGSEDPSRFDLAAVIYERNCLLPTAPLPIRLEAGFKWAHSLRQQGDPDGWEAVFWLLYERFVKDPDIVQAIVHDQAGRYWLSRILFELGALQAAKGEIALSRQVYETILNMNLPGSALAGSRLEALEETK